RGEAAGPEAVAEDGDFRGLGEVLFLREGAAAKRGGAEQAEEVGADLRLLDLLREAGAREVGDTAGEGGDRLHDARLRAPVIELGRRGAPAATLRRRIQEEHESVGLREGGGLEEDGVYDREDRSVRSDAQGERGD